MSLLVDAISAKVLQENHKQSSQKSEHRDNSTANYELLLKWLLYPVYVTKHQLAKISGCSLREIEQLIALRQLPIYLPPGAKRPKYSLADLIHAMQAYKSG